MTNTTTHIRDDTRFDDQPEVTEAYFDLGSSSLWLPWEMLWYLTVAQSRRSQDEEFAAYSTAAAIKPLVSGGTLSPRNVDWEGANAGGSPPATDVKGIWTAITHRVIYKGSVSNETADIRMAILSKELERVDTISAELKQDMGTGIGDFYAISSQASEAFGEYSLTDDYSAPDSEIYRLLGSKGKNLLADLQEHISTVAIDLGWPISNVDIDYYADPEISGWEYIIVSPVFDCSLEDADNYLRLLFAYIDEFTEKMEESEQDLFRNKVSFGVRSAFDVSAN